MKHSKRFIISAGVLLSICVPAISQDFEAQILKMIERNQIAELKKNLAMLKRKYPDSPTPFYVEAFIEKDGERAVGLYKAFLARFSDNQHVPNVKYKIAQYYFARGSYHTALRYLGDIWEKHPDYPIADDAGYLGIRCLIALEQIDQAERLIKRFLHKYSESSLTKLVKVEQKLIEDSDYFQRKVSNQADRSKKPGPSKYAIQVGAFRDRDNAYKHKENVSKWGYSVEVASRIINNHLYHLVWIGGFDTEQQALEFGEIFKKRYGLPFRIVQK
ncbi:tetratricopeptide repeat protein [candidate division KSB1 bacterium]|nr:tetratricopeptide repeat protein [candidate division KSB1 bacterium]